MTKNTKRATPRRRDTGYVVASFSIPKEWRATLKRSCAKSHMSFSRIVCDALRPVVEGVHAK